MHDSGSIRAITLAKKNYEIKVYKVSDRFTVSN